MVGWVWFWIFGGVSVGLADWREQIEKFHPSLTLQEQYNDNLNLTKEDKISDFITTLYPGLKYLAVGNGYSFDLKYELGMNFYADHTENNYLSHDGILKTWYAFNPHWTVRLNDSLTRSRDRVGIPYTVTTPTGETTVNNLDSGEGLFLRNIFEPSVDYKFGREDMVTLLYRNMIYRTDGTGEDSTDNSAFGRLQYWFNIHHGLFLDYTYSNAEFSVSPDWVGNNLGGRYVYRFNPRTLAYGEYRFSIRDFEFPSQDYAVHSPTIGGEHAFSPTLSGAARLGWFWQVVDVGPSFNGPVYSLSSSLRGAQTTFTVSFDGGFREEFFTSDNLGPSKYNQLTLAVTHKLQQRLTVGFSGSVDRSEYQSPDDRIDWIYSVSGSLSYQPLRWLIISLVATNQTRDSELDQNSYNQNKVILRLTAEF
ncbi:MAG: outer membrane beta-barrel protein [Deltaproteobacteria bacterium]|nr:outer membrane beta-barrel protein [Deltaproteobacteria bacterium]